MRLKRCLYLQLAQVKLIYLLFDAKAFKPKRLLFVVHRLTIAQKSLETFQNIFGADRTMGLYSGAERELDKDFLFATVQNHCKTKALGTIQ